MNQVNETSVVFENAALSEAIKRVSKVAPKSGEAFDKASGIVIEVNPDWEMALIKATNLQIYYSEWVTRVSGDGPAMKWRVGSEIFAQIITKLPIGSGKTVTITEKDNKLQISSGRFRASIGIIRAGYYPDWNQFDPEGTQPVMELGTKIEQVQWAASKGGVSDLSSGIRFNGSTIVANDKYRLACVQCDAPHLPGEVTIPPSILASLVSPTGPTKMGIAGDQLFLVPNDYTQIRCITYAGDYPKVENVMHRDHPNVIEIERGPFLEAVNRVSSADTKNRMPELSIYLGNEEISLFMEDTSGGDKTIDQINYPGQATHDLFRIFIAPASIVDALTASPTDKVKLHYDATNKMKILRVEGGNGYESWIVPRTGVRSLDES